MWINKFSLTSDYTLIPQEIRSLYGCLGVGDSAEQVFHEMVGHRLAMGFQMVVPKDTFTYNTKESLNESVTGNGHSPMGLRGTYLL